MADERGRWSMDEYDTNRGDHGGFGGEDDGEGDFATTRAKNSQHNRARRFNTLTDFLE